MDPNKSEKQLLSQLQKKFEDMAKDLKEVYAVSDKREVETKVGPKIVKTIKFVYVFKD